MNRDVDFSRWAIVSYNDDTGLGRMAQDARDVLGIARQLVIPSQRLETKPLAPGDLLLSDETGESELEFFLSELEGLLVLEKADWTGTLLPLATRAGLAVVAVPMWEWFRAEDPLWRCCDLFVCPNLKCLEVVREAGFQNAVHLPWALNLNRFPPRRIRGAARTFFHNAGLVDSDDRKATRDTIEAFKRVGRSDLKLIVRVQKQTDLPKLDPRIELRVGNVADPADLYAEGEVAVQPSKMEGLGFMVLEPICTGVPVITLNAAPMNEYGPAELLVKPRRFGRAAFASQWVPHAQLRLPRVNDLAQKIQFCADADLENISRQQRTWAEETFAPEILRRKWSAALSSIANSALKLVPA